MIGSSSENRRQLPLFVFLLLSCIQLKGISFDTADAWSLFRSRDSKSQSRSFKFLYSSSRNNVKDILDTVCVLVKPRIPWFSQFMLHGKICDWNMDSRATDKFLQSLYKLYRTRIETTPAITKALDVVEGRYLKSKDTNGLIRVMNVVKMPEATALTENAIPAIQELAVQNLITVNNIKQVITLALNMIELIPMSTFLKDLIRQLNKQSKKQQLVIIKEFTSQLLLFTQFDKKYSKKAIKDYKKNKHALEHIAYNLVEISSIESRTKKSLLRSYETPKENFKGLEIIWKSMKKAGDKRFARSLPFTMQRNNYPLDNRLLLLQRPLDRLQRYN